MRIVPQERRQRSHLTALSPDREETAACDLYRQFMLGDTHRRPARGPRPPSRPCLNSLHVENSLNSNPRLPHSIYTFRPDAIRQIKNTSRIDLQMYANAQTEWSRPSMLRVHTEPRHESAAMQSNQHASNHPIPMHKTQGMPATGAGENQDRPQHGDSRQQRDSDRVVLPVPARHPARSEWTSMPRVPM